MVRAVCRQILHDPNDVNDAFQATFLVLVQRAGAIRVEKSLAPWLHGVACKVAARLRTNLLRRRSREGAGDGNHVISPHDSEGAERSEVLPLLQEELSRLPEKYRVPVVLCHLEGKSHEEAARELSWPVGTLSGRLSRARDMLRSRLNRRGVTSAAGIIPLLDGQPLRLPAGLLETTTHALSPVAEARTPSRKPSPRSQKE